eukprot:403357558
MLQNFGFQNFNMRKEERLKQNQLQQISSQQSQLYKQIRHSYSSWDNVSRRELVEFGFTQDLEVIRVSRNFKTAMEWCIEKDLLPSKRVCKMCTTVMKIVRNTHQNADGYAFRCPNLECKFKMSMRKGTVFDCSKLTIMEMMRLIFHYFIRNYNATQAHLELREMINDRINPYGVPGTKFKHEDDIYRINYKSVFTLFKLARTQIHVWTQNLYRRTKLGKFGRAVEIDESVFAHHTQDGKKEKVWVLGFYERGTKEARAIHVKDRTEETLTQVILENVEEGAEIFTDFWRGYNGLKYYYKHRVVNKAMKGYGTSEFQTTNRVEGLWAAIKRFFQVYSCFNHPYLQQFLDEAIWRRKYKSYKDRINFLIQLNTYFNFRSESENHFEETYLMYNQALSENYNNAKQKNQSVNGRNFISKYDEVYQDCDQLNQYLNEKIQDPLSLVKSLLEDQKIPKSLQKTEDDGSIIMESNCSGLLLDVEEIDEDEFGDYDPEINIENNIE